MQHVTLDRAQRAAIRGELEMCASGWGDFAISLRNGDRKYVYSNLARLRRIAQLMDAIGWSEQPDAPDKLTCQCSRALKEWARREARSLLSAFDEFVPSDHDLDAYRALCGVGGGA
jgi:hypothetical protein